VYQDNGATLKLFGYIYVQLGLICKGEYFFRKATNIGSYYAKTFLCQVVSHFLAFILSAAFSVYYKSNHVHMSREIEVMTFVD